MNELEKQLELDVKLYGVAYERRHPDGTRERIPPIEVVMHKPFEHWSEEDVGAMRELYDEFLKDHREGGAE